ncbi:hypothetical protein EG68_12435 [Paragonimus skrjabini miyazakii]|uniref:Uncharacterized protein n=1 Tax=Paragonimus skrjabini miyazakii TaxID=59628 RepID=A0A8S9YG67_9TREM|nr:hypothetical protein EG68_12435 [Paragonimus skrjabini miyazakii]
MGHGRPVMYGYVRSEKYASLRKLFEIFRDLMGEHITVKTFVMDKMAAQMRAARVVFGCDVLLCYFHVRDAVRKHVSFPIHDRWLAEYNLPIRRLVGPKLQPLVASNFNRQYKALHHLLAKLHECSSRTAVTCFNSIIAATSKTVERAKADLPLSDFPIVISSGNKQPRWVKKIRMGLPCGYCGEPVQTDSYRCETDELIFHSDCIRTADIWECPFCGKQLQPPSPVPSTSADVHARQMTQLQTPSPNNVPTRPKNKSCIPSIMDVDLDRSPDNVPCASQPKKARINIFCSDSSADIIQQNLILDARDSKNFL